MKKHLYIWVLSVLLLIAAAFALRLAFFKSSDGKSGNGILAIGAGTAAGMPPPLSDTTAKMPSPHNIVKWRVPISSQMECMTGTLWHDSNRWVVGERSGRITALSSDRSIRWQVTHSNQNWQAIAPLGSGNLVAVSFQGTVCLLDVSDGKILWKRETDGTFMHAPLLGWMKDEDKTYVMWQLSQSDSTIFCLRVSDGELLWKSEPSNRCDGRPALWDNKLVFGNCDGVVYVVDANTGKSLGTIETGGQSDPMAGEMVAVWGPELMVTGTYLGNFLLLDPKTMTLLDKVKIADSETFATPVVIGDSTVAMGTPDGRITLWDTRERKLQSKGEIHVSKDGIDEIVFDDDVGIDNENDEFVNKKDLWVLAGRTLNRVCLKSQDVQTFNIGDNMKYLTKSYWGSKLALLADGDVVCLDLVTVVRGVPAVQKGKTE